MAFDDSKTEPLVSLGCLSVILALVAPLGGWWWSALMFVLLILGCLSFAWLWCGENRQRLHASTLTTEQQHGTLLGPCFPLRFLVRPESRAVTRQNLPGFSDSAVFHRWMDLFWTLREPEAIALLTPEEKGYLVEFTAALNALPWKPIEDHPHISEVADGDLSTLVPSATRLLESLERRTRPSVVQRVWRKILATFG